MKTFKDILKKSFLEGMNYEFSLKELALVFVVATLLGLFVFAVYRINTRKSFYSKSFNISLVAMTVITAAIIVTIQSNAVISLGMVGALSIVRFRTAVKDPMDLVFLFWSIGLGIIAGSGMFGLAFLLAAAIAMIICVLELLPVAKAPVLLVVSLNDMEDEEFIGLVETYAKGYRVKSHNVTKNGTEYILELRVKDGAELVKNVAKLSNVKNVSLLQHDGEVTF